MDENEWKDKLQNDIAGTLEDKFEKVHISQANEDEYPDLLEDEYLFYVKIDASNRDYETFEDVLIDVEEFVEDATDMTGRVHRGQTAGENGSYEYDLYIAV